MKKAQILLFGIMLLAGIAGGLRNAEAYQNYAGSTSCSSCHPDFSSRGPLHDLHVSAMTGTCSLCHDQNGDNPQVAKCAGCHVGPGLRAHHENSGSDTCYDCHNATTPTPENIAPPYYSRTDVTVKNPCQAQPAPPGEDFNGDLVGLDNDGDLLYDTQDPNCSPPSTTTTVRPTTTTTSVRPTTTTTSVRPTTTTSVLPTTTTTSIRPTTTTSVLPTTTTLSAANNDHELSIADNDYNTANHDDISNADYHDNFSTASKLPTTSVRPTTTTSVLPTDNSIRPTYDTDSAANDNNINNTDDN